MICISLVSHGQADIAAGFLECLARLKPHAVQQVIYTRNIPELPALPVKDLGHIRLTFVDNVRARGFGHNHNAAFEHCDQPFYCVVNPDILMPTDPFPALLECLTEETLGLVAPLVTSPGGNIENTARLLYTPREMLMQKFRPGNHGPDSDWLAGMFMLFRSDAYRSIGGFDKGYFLYIEDVDICSRLRLAGWRLRQCMEARVIHDARKQSHRSLKFTWWHLAGMLRYWFSTAFWRYRAMLGSQRKMDKAAQGEKRRRAAR